MALVTLPYTLVAGQPEDVSQLMSDLVELVNGVNNIEAANIATGAVTTAKITDANVTKAKLATDALNAFLKLNSAADKKVAFGTFNSGSFGNAKMVTGSTNHGLGATPVLVLMTAGAIATQTPSSSAVAASWDGTVGGTSFGWRLNIADGGISNNGVNVYWLAIA